MDCNEDASVIYSTSFPDDPDSDDAGSDPDGHSDDDEPVIQEMLQNVVSSPVPPDPPKKRSIHDLVAGEISSTTVEYLKKAGVELSKGLNLPPKVDAHGNRDTKPRAPAKTPRRKPKKTSISTSNGTPSSESKSIKLLAGIILNVHGLQERDNGGLDLRVNKAWNQTSIDYYKKLGLAAVDICGGIKLDLQKNHEDSIATLATYIPVLQALYPVEDDSTAAPWVLCSQYRSNLSVMPEPNPTLADLYNKRSQPSKTYQSQYVHICSRRPISKETVLKYSQLPSAEFDTWWSCLAKFENWEDTTHTGTAEDDSESDYVADSRTRGITMHCTASGSRKRVHTGLSGLSDSEEPPRRRSSRFASIIKTEKQSITMSSKGKGKERVIDEDIESIESGPDSDPSEIIGSSPVPPAKRFDPWQLDRKFAF
ncbi:hypothetical protein VKT23_015448 [Stygiomarasmius scandens]|uniref:Uncharacterized protein n=1 Tax=Marasmiellus scandens TaxID=2682957 RepID=A0ABR1IXP9_9AGAR